MVLQREQSQPRSGPASWTSSHRGTPSTGSRSNGSDPKAPVNRTHSRRYARSGAGC